MSLVQTPTRPQVRDAGASRLAVQRMVWSRVRRLFPEHAIALPTGGGGLAISWPLQQDPAGASQATPIFIRFEAGWLDAMQHGSATDQLMLVAQADETVRAGMVGYEPSTGVPQRRVIVVG